MSDAKRGAVTALPAPTMIAANGLDMAVYEAGKGLPVVLCHGFPELAYSWRYQIPALAKAGYHVLAPDQRGYGLTSRPDAVEDYDIHHLTGDLCALLDHYGYDRAVFVGHDWGGFVVWQMPLNHPDRVAGVIGLNTPYRPRLPMDPIALMRQMYGEDMYIVSFQKPGVADAALAADVAKSMRFFFRKTGMTQAAYQALPEEQRRLAFIDAIKSPESTWPGSPLMDADELAFYVETFGRTGFTGGINWYRNFTRNWQTTEHLPQHIGVPSLMIMAENDVVLPPSAADGMEEWVPDLERYLVKDCGHWTQQEHPDEVNRAMIDWLKRRYS